MKVLAMATAMLLVSMPLVAQQHGHEGHGDQPRHEMGMKGEHCMRMMGGPPPAMLLQHQEELGLSADQVRRIERLQAGADGASHMGAVMAAHREAAELLHADRPDFAAYEARLRAAADHMIQAHTQMARTAVQAREVLTPEQRERVANLAHGMACPMMGMTSGAEDAHGGHHNH